jgi:hypothetical protein
MKRTAFVVASVIIAAALAIGAVLYLLDVQGDRDTIITITGPVRVFDSESPPGYIRGDNGSSNSCTPEIPRACYASTITTESSPSACDYATVAKVTSSAATTS